jgi:hypothetical protein
MQKTWNIALEISICHIFGFRETYNYVESSPCLVAGTTPRMAFAVSSSRVKVAEMSSYLNKEIGNTFFGSAPQ